MPLDLQCLVHIRNVSHFYELQLLAVLLVNFQFLSINKTCLSNVMLHRTGVILGIKYEQGWITNWLKVQCIQIC